MPTSAIAQALAGGVLSALLYYVSFALGLGFLFLFLPTLPLFWLALSRHDASALHAALIATILIAVTSGPASSMVFFFMLAMPTVYIGYESLKYGRFGNETIWFPLNVAFTKLVSVFCFFVLGLTLYYAGQEGGLPAIIAQRITEAFSTLFSELPDNESLAITSMANDMAFLVFSVTAWMWITSLYLHGWVINRELVRRKKNIRPHFKISIIPPQNWLITLMLIAAIASIIGSESMAFWGKASLVTLLLPHFLLGLALIHERSKTMSQRAILLFFIYFLVALLLWPAFFIAGYGLYYHLRLLNKYLSAGGTSFKN